MNARYARNILLDGVGSSGQQRLCRSWVLVVGMGGVGSHTAIGLAGLGVNLGICDYDRIEETNLNRQFLYRECDVGRFKVDVAAQRLLEYNPHIQVKKYKMLKRISNFYSVVVDCTDSVESRIAVSKACEKSGVPLVYASAVGYTARVSTFTKTYLHNLTIIGKEEEGCSALGIFPPLAIIAGSIAASEAAKLILNMRCTLENKMMIIDVKENKIKTIKIQ